MKIIVCYKWVIDESDLRIDPATLEVSADRAKSKISEYDKNALECGVKLIEEQGGTVTALTMGTDTIQESLKDVLSRGATEVSYISDSALANADSRVISKVLAAAVNKIGNYDLIICGEGSSDSYSQQVGMRISELLGIPMISFVNKIEVINGRIRAERNLESGIEVIETSLPAVISVLPDINTPRIPSLKDILGAKKKVSNELKLSDLEVSTEVLLPKNKKLEIKGATTKRQRNIYQGDISDLVPKFVEVLKSKGL